MESNKAALADIIQYTPETYFSDDELALLRASFNGPSGGKLLKVIRKALLPTISDLELPLEEMGKDVFMAGVDFRSVPDGEVKPTVLGLQLAVKIVAGSLIQLKNLANIKDESPTERAAREAKNSAK